ncbi:hypothetical protein RvY_19192-2 [Ramazzottius varieornatus]|uniref:Uncharacterized protein n=1 Tax=Ramazzottius varieornatus TaxID=947166 RepID=A0A1D1W8K4_RAMVA|nr:hypothetical protein RvY_19192-2 [Ramazzottius varieornatus]
MLIRLKEGMEPSSGATLGSCRMKPRDALWATSSAYDAARSSSIREHRVPWCTSVTSALVARQTINPLSPALLSVRCPTPSPKRRSRRCRKLVPDTAPETTKALKKSGGKASRT